MKYAVITFGCRVNQADSLGFEEDFLARGAVPASAADADVIVVNTCSVTATSDQGARQTIRRVARDNPNAQIIVTGCYATRQRDEVAALPNVVRVIPNDGKLSLVRSVRLQLEDGLGDGPCGATVEPGVAGRTAYTLRVQTGCAEPCSYCIIPTTRGRPQSTPIEILLRDLDRVVAAGFKEIALTGVHLGSYGRDLTPPVSLSRLLRSIDEWTSARGSHERPLFRISSLEPMDCTREIVDLVATSDTFAPHFHLPLQHASDRVLAAMRRPYGIGAYAPLVERIHATIPHVSIGTDVIVGFPGETDADFEQLATFLERSPLTHVHVFPYSDRPGTVASSMAGKIHGAVVRERARRVREIAHRLTDRFHDSEIGALHRALTLEDGSLVVTGNYLKLRVPPGRARNEWVRVRVISHDAGELLSG